MSYQALYRQWRPKIFSDLVGQEHVVTTLENSIKQDRISHAYLFSGPRGTGKTSAAKVLAKTLNCNYRRDEEPCGECSNCKDHDFGSFMELVEIDAASNRGIDEIREIRDHVAYTPTMGKYKIYIVDEVHMLTTEAFNALLKTLEEPPDYVIFILATTEPHKLPMTVLSRCQRFDFYRLSERKIIAQLQEVVNSKDISASQDSLAVIAKKSEGGMRDALSLLDQCLSYLGDDQQLELKHVLEITGAVSEDVFYDLLVSLQQGDLQNVLQIVQDLSDSGKDFGQFLNDMIIYVRDLLLYEMSGGPDQLLWGTEETLKKLQGQFTKEQLLTMIDFLSEKQTAMKWSQNRRLIIEMACYRLINNSGNANEVDMTVSSETAATTEVEQFSPTREQKQSQKQSELPSSSEKDDTKDINSESKEEENSEISDTDEKKASLQFAQVQNKWEKVLEKLKQKKISAHALVVEGKPVDVRENIIYLEFEQLYKLHKERVEQKEKGLLDEVAKEVFGDVTVKCILANGNQSKRSEDSEKLGNDNDNDKDKDNDKGVGDLTGMAKQEFGPDKVEIYKQN